MAFETTKDLLEYLRNYHRKLSGLYERMAEESEQSKVKMLLHFLGRHEARFDKIIKEYEEDAADRVLGTWFKVTPDRLPRLKGSEVTPDMPVDDIMSAALHFDDGLIEFCRLLATEAGSEDVRDLFTSLVDLEQQEERKMAGAVQEF